MSLDPLGGNNSKESEGSFFVRSSSFERGMIQLGSVLLHPTAGSLVLFPGDYTSQRLPLVGVVPEVLSSLPPPIHYFMTVTAATQWLDITSGLRLDGLARCIHNEFVSYDDAARKADRALRGPGEITHRNRTPGRLLRHLLTHARRSGWFLDLCTRSGEQNSRRVSRSKIRCSRRREDLQTWIGAECGSGHGARSR